MFRARRSFDVLNNVESNKSFKCIRFTFGTVTSGSFLITSFVHSKNIHQRLFFPRKKNVKKQQNSIRRANKLKVKSCLRDECNRKLLFLWIEREQKSRRHLTYYMQLKQWKKKLQSNWIIRFSHANDIAKDFSCWTSSSSSFIRYFHLPKRILASAVSTTTASQYILHTCLIPSWSMHVMSRLSFIIALDDSYNFNCTLPRSGLCWAKFHSYQVSSKLSTASQFVVFRLSCNKRENIAGCEDSLIIFHFVWFWQTLFPVVRLRLWRWDRMRVEPTHAI